MKSSMLMKTIAATALSAAFILSSPAIHAADDRANGSNGCLPGIESAYDDHKVYGKLFAALDPETNRLRTLLDDVNGQAAYKKLLNRAEKIASGVRNGRVVITLPDGTVVLDTAAVDDPGNTMPSGNSFEHFRNKTVNENHNSRVAILSAQLFPCGVGLERKLSTSTGATESYFAIRLGSHLDNSGTVRLSTVQ